MNSVSFMTSVSIAVQVIMWAATTITGYALTMRFAGYAAVKTNTDFARAMVQRLATEDELKKTFPGSDQTVGELNITPEEVLKEKEKHNEQLRTNNREEEKRLEKAEIHTKDAKDTADRLKSFNGRVEGVDSEFSQALAAYRETKAAGLPERNGASQLTPSPPTQSDPMSSNNQGAKKGEEKKPLPRKATKSNRSQPRNPRRNRRSA